MIIKYQDLQDAIIIKYQDLQDVGRSRGTGMHIINLNSKVFRFAPRPLSPGEGVSAAL